MVGEEIDLRGHLDAERLSALVDGTAEAGAGAHIADCRQCRERLRSWQMVRDRVAALDDDRARRVLDTRRAQVVSAVTADTPPLPRRSRRGWRCLVGHLRARGIAR